MQVLSYKSQPPLDWDNFILNSGEYSGLCQSSYWARVLSRVDNSIPVFLVVINNENKILAALLFFHKTPWDRRTMKKQKGLKHYLLGNYKGWIEWLDGPVIKTKLNSMDRVKVMRLLLDEVCDYALKNRLMRSNFLGFPHISTMTKNMETKRLFKEYGYSSEKWGTFLVKLDFDEDYLWKQIDRAARKNINKCIKQGIRVTEAKSFEEFVLNFYNPYVFAENAFGRQVDSIDVFKVMWEEDVQGYYHYYYVKLQNDILATLGMYVFNGVATEISSSLSPKAYEMKIPAQDLLHWHLLLEAKKMGCHTFDLAGVSPNPQNSKEEGIRRFKAKWGGEYVEYYRYELIRGVIPRAVNNLRAKYNQLCGK